MLVAVLILISLGGGLQVAGVILTAVQVHRAGKEYRSPGTDLATRARKSARNWRARVGELLRREPPHVIADAGVANVRVATQNSTSRIGRPPISEDAPLADQVRELERRQHADLEAHYQLVRDLQAREEALRSTISEIREALEKADTETRHRVEKLATGGFRMTAWSVVMIAAGTVMVVVAAALAV